MQEMIVITGPVYAPVYVNNEWVHINRTIGTFPKLVHVPTHFFKVVVYLKKGHNSQKSTAIVPSNGSSAEWWPAADTTYDAVISVGAFMVANNDSVDSKVWKHKYTRWLDCWGINFSHFSLPVFYCTQNIVTLLLYNSITLLLFRRPRLRIRQCVWTSWKEYVSQYVSALPYSSCITISSRYLYY